MQNPLAGVVCPGTSAGNMCWGSNWAIVNPCSEKAINHRALSIRIPEISRSSWGSQILLAYNHSTLLSRGGSNWGRNENSCREPPVTGDLISFNILTNYNNSINFNTEILAKKGQILQLHPPKPHQRHRGVRTVLGGVGN